MTDLRFDQINAAILFDLLWSKPLWLASNLSAVSCFSSVQLQDLCAAPVRLHPPSPVHSVSLHPSVCLSADSISPSWPTVTSCHHTRFSHPFSSRTCPLSSLFQSIQPYISWIRYRLLQALLCTQTFLHKSTLCWWLEWWTTSGLESRQVREQDTLHLH